MLKVFRFINTVVLAAIITGCSGPAEKVILEPLFSDNMVLQQQQDIPVWGKASPGGQVTVTLAGQTQTVKAGRDSSWNVTFAPLQATADPVAFTVAGKDTIRVSNAVVGEVWLASGQSNMEFSLWNPLTRKGVVDGEEEVKKADYPLIRHIKINKTASASPVRQVPSDGWQVCTPEFAGEFTAVGYFFARDIHASQKVPVGIINSNWGGTRIEPWTSAEALNTLPEFVPKVAAVGTSVALRGGPEKFRAEMDAWLDALAAKDPGYTGKWYAEGFDDAAWRTAGVPGFVEEHYPAANKLDGVVWYRTTFTLPAGWAGKDAVVHLGAIDDADVTWINGMEVGAGEGWNVIRKYDVSAGILKAGRNVLAIRVTDERYNGGFWGKPADYYLVRNGEKIIIAGSWKTAAAFDFKDIPGKPAWPAEPKRLVTALYNGMIAPLVPYAMRGVIWYQGESNGNPAGGLEYRKLMPLLINDWRTKWGIGDFPFYLVQLANFRSLQTRPVEGGWANLREAQLMTVRSVPNTGMAVTIDIGEAKDIHPRNKQNVGRRLALVARNLTYGEKDVVYSGPLFKEARYDGNKAVLLFDHVHDGLTTSDKKSLTGFAVAGPDSQFVWANATIDGDNVVVSSQNVKEIKAVRYGWAHNPTGNLANKNGLPASPFRTDVDNN